MSIRDKLSAIGPERKRNDERWLAYGFVTPATVTVLLLTTVPLLWSLWLTFHQWQPGITTGAEFNGIENYVWALTSPRFWNSVQNFVYYGVVGTTIQVALALALALALHTYVQDSRLRLGLLVLFILPMMFAGVIVAGIWKLMFTPSGGVVNGLLQLIGIGRVNWLGSRWMALTALMVADVWQWTGFPLIILYSGRASINDSMYRAARIDGASTWMIFRRITFPQLKNLIVIAFILRFLGVYKLFDKLFVMTRGGPGSATELPTYLAYLTGLRQFQIGRGATITWLIVVGLVVVMYLFYQVSSEQVEVQQ